MRVVSGIKPTGNLHLGNYLGAVKQWVTLQDDVAAQGGESMFFIADLHAPTEWIAPAELSSHTIEVAATMIAAGIDPAKSILFNQARVPAHSEMAWLLNTVARVGWLNRMTQFKDKAGKNREGASVGGKMSAADERAVEHRDVDRAGDRGGERRAHVPERLDEGEVEDEVHDHRHRRIAHRRARVGACVIAGRENLHEDVRRQPDREGGERLRGQHAVLERELAVLEQRADDRHAADDQRDRRGERQEQRELHAAVLRRHRLRILAAAQLARDGG